MKTFSGNWKYNKGFSLVELMVAIVLASLMSISVISIYTSQTGRIVSETQREIITAEANRAYDLITRLIRQANINSVLITYNNPGVNGDIPEKTTDDQIDIIFELPLGFNTWPNNVPPFDKNIVRITWTNTNEDKYRIRVSNADSVANLNLGQIVAGANSGEDARIVNLDVWPMADQFTRAASATAAPTSGYYVSVTTRAATPDNNHSNINETRDAFKRYYTHTVTGIASPRN